MLFTISLSLVGLITVFAMIMMIGNVLTGSKYGKTWAMVAGGSLMMAGLLLVVQLFVPDAVAQEPADAEHGEQTAHAAEAQDKPAAGKPTATEAAAKPDSAANGAVVDAAELAYLTAVLDSLKQGKPIPQEYLALLPDGGKGIQAMQANSGVKQEESKLSEPLLQQIVAVARSQGKTVDTANSYVPTAPKAPANTPQARPGTVATTQPPANTGTQPAQTPAPAPAPAPAPSKPANTTPQPAPAPKPTPAPPVQQPTPAPQPQPKPQPAAGSLVDGGVLKSVLGKSKADVKSFFQYNQFLGENGNTLTYLRGSTVVEVTMNGDSASSVYMRFDRLNPPNREQSYYESFMMGVAGLSQAEPSSRNGQDLRWNSVYSGASSIQLHVDSASNSGYIRASR